MYDFLYTLVLKSFMTTFLDQASKIHEENKELFKGLLVVNLFQFGHNKVLKMTGYFW